MNFRQRILALKGERNELRREILEIKASAEGDIIAVNELIDGFTPLEELKLEIALEQIKELMRKKNKLLSKMKKLKEIEEKLRDFNQKLEEE